MRITLPDANWLTSPAYTDEVALRIGHLVQQLQRPGQRLTILPVVMVLLAVMCVQDGILLLAAAPHGAESIQEELRLVLPVPDWSMPIVLLAVLVWQGTSVARRVMARAQATGLAPMEQPAV